MADRNAAADQTIGASFVIDANGAQVIDANGEEVIINDPGQFLQVATGASLAGGFASQTIAALTQTATGAGLGSGAAAQVIAPVTQVATGAPNFLAAAAQTIDAITQVAEGHSDEPGFPIPEDTTSPVVSGLAAPSGILSCTTGTFGAAVVLSYRFQWRRAGTDIPGETSSDHFVTGEDGGQILACMVTAVTADTTLDQLSNEVLIDEAGSGTGSTASTSTKSNRKPLWWQSPPKKKTKKSAAIVPPPKPKPPIHVPRYDPEVAAIQRQAIDGVLSHTARMSEQMRRQAIEQDDEAILLSILQ